MTALYLHVSLSNTNKNTKVHSYPTERLKKHTVWSLSYRDNSSESHKTDLMPTGEGAQSRTGQTKAAFFAMTQHRDTWLDDQASG